MNRLLALLVAFSAPLLAADDEYDIRFDRPKKAGQKFTLKAMASVDSVTTVSAQSQVVQEEKLNAEVKLEGELEVVSVSSDGRVMEARLKVTKCESKQDDAAAEVFKAGDVIHAGTGEKGKRSVDVNEKDATPAQSELASMLLLESDTKVPDQEVFGAGKKVKVGDSWKVNGAAAARSLPEMPDLKADSINGTVTFDGLEDVGGTKCCLMKIGITINGSGFTVPNAPPGIKVRSMDLSIVDKSAIPVDPAIVIPKDRMSLNMEMSAGGEIENDGRKIPLTLSVHRKQVRETEVSPVK